MHDFNPRTPCGVRLVPSVFCTTPSVFQPTHPLRGATEERIKVANHRIISTHAPLAGCDRWRLQKRLKSSQFQPTHPLRGATAEEDCRVNDLAISTHAPLAGCDAAYSLYTLPSYSISTHAPLAGCDSAVLRVMRLGEFQPTHPLRGATRLEAFGSDFKNYFNPRTPCGVRRHGQVVR